MARWFIVNVADAPAQRHAVAGSYVPFEADDDRFEEGPVRRAVGGALERRLNAILSG